MDETKKALQEKFGLLQSGMRGESERAMLIFLLLRLSQLN